MNIDADAADDARWTFLSNHAHALIGLARDGDCRVRDLAAFIGITERATQRILGDLETAGYLARERHGRRTHHRLLLDRPLRHPMERMHSVREVVEMLSAVPRPTTNDVTVAPGPHPETRASERPAPTRGA